MVSGASRKAAGVIYRPFVSPVTRVQVNIMMAGWTDAGRAQLLCHRGGVSRRKVLLGRGGCLLLAAAGKVGIIQVKGDTQ